MCFNFLVNSSNCLAARVLLQRLHDFQRPVKFRAAHRHVRFALGAPHRLLELFDLLHGFLVNFQLNTASTSLVFSDTARA